MEDGFGGGLRGIGVAGDELLGFGAEGQVREEDVTFLVEEGARKGEVDPWVCLLSTLFLFSFVFYFWRDNWKL